MDDFIYCPICFEAYDDKVCAPLLLNACNYIETNERKESANNYYKIEFKSDSRPEFLEDKTRILN